MITKRVMIKNKEKVTKEYILKNLITKSNTFNSNKFKYFDISPEYYWCKTKSEYLNCILLNIDKPIKCFNDNCNDNVKYNSRLKKKYNLYCSNKCLNICEKNKKKRKETNIKRYGVENPAQATIVKEKKEKTNIEKYGFKSSLQNKEVQNKIKETILNKYGVEYPSQNIMILEKIKETNILKYGVECVFKNKEIQNKIKKTMLNKYGVEHPSQNIIIQEKIKETNVLKYGVEYPSQNKEIQNKIKKTNISKYGVEYPIQDSKIKQYQLKNRIENCIKKYGVKHKKQINIRNIKNLNKEFIDNNLVKNNKINIKDIEEYFNIKTTTSYKYLQLLGLQNKTSYKKENEIDDFFNNIFDINNRQIININNHKLELDMFSKKYNFAIEYNGLMFHSFGKSKHSMFNNYIKEYEYIYNDLEKDNKYINYKNKDKYLLKTELCEEKNIHLFHINENEWLNPIKQKIWKFIINKEIKTIDIQKNRLLNKKIKENKDIIELIDINKIEKKDKNKHQKIIDFINNNSLENYVESDIILIFINEIKDGKDEINYRKEIKGVMLLSKRKENKKKQKYKNRKQNGEEYIINNYCLNIKDDKLDDNKCFNLLLKTFEKEYNPKSIEIKVNRRWINKNNNIYLNNNFQLKEVIETNYYYFNEKNHKDIVKEDNKQKNTSDEDNMYNKFYRKIYDSGYLLYEKRENTK